MPTVTPPQHAEIEGHTVADIGVLRSKATDHRRSAGELPEPLAAAYRRRAAELELEAAALAARFGVVEELKLAA